MDLALNSLLFTEVHNMKTPCQLLIHILAIAGFMAVMPVSAADKVYLRATPEGTIELSNSAGDGTVEESVIANEPAPSSGPQAPNTARANSSRPYQPAPARTRADELADAAGIQPTSSDKAEASTTASGNGNNANPANTGFAWASPFGSSGSGGTGSSTIQTPGSTSNVALTNPPLNAPAATVPTSIATPATPATNNTSPVVASTNTPVATPNTPTNSTLPPAVSTTPPVDGSLSASLQKYRDLMLQNAVEPTGPANPALVRRYLAVDRAGFQSQHAR